MATLGAYLGLGMHLAHRNPTQTLKIQYKHSPLVVRATTAEAPEAATAVEEKPRQAIPGTRRKKLIIPRLRGEYLQKIVPQLWDEFNYENVHQIPKLEKIVVNCGIGDEAQNAKTLEMVTKELAEITGQWPIKTRAKKPIASFKIKKGSIVGLSVTLRGKLMYDFVDRIVNVALPRSRDFQGVSPYAFDGNGNYNLGINDHSMFPEIDAETVDKRRGMNISISTTAKTDNEAYKLLYHMGMPFNDGVSNF